jgi:hypothetical protein
MGVFFGFEHKEWYCKNCESVYYRKIQKNVYDSPFLWESSEIYLLIINLFSSAAAVIKQFRAWSLKNASSNLVRIAATLGRSLLMFKN